MTETLTASLPAKMTYEEFLEWADEDTHAEWVNGQVLTLSPVSEEHQNIGLFLLRILSDFVEAHQLGVLRYESFQMRTGPNLPGREPDILFVAASNLSRLKKNYLDGPADLVIEIVSPESRARDRGEKYYEYEQGGVPEYWLVDPLRRQTEFYQRGASGFYLAVMPDQNGRYRSTSLPGLWINPDWLWQNPLPRPAAVLKEWGFV